MNNLLHFAGRLIEQSDGVVEWTDAGDAFQALLPDAVRDHLGLNASLVTISGRSGDLDAGEHISIGYGTELLERAIPMALEMGSTGAVRMPALSSRKPPDLSLGSAFSFPNAAFQEKADQESWLDYWLWSFNLTADADERRQALHRVCLSSLGAGCPSLSERLLENAPDWEPLKVKEGDFQKDRLEALFVTACDRCLREMDQSLSGFSERVKRRHVRDIQRLESYFQDLSREMEEEIQRKHLEGAALEIRQEKIRQLEGEKVRKLATLTDKYRLRITISPVSLLLARLPVRRMDLLIKRRKNQRRISVVYNLLSREFDAMACEACGLDTTSLGFCDEALHLLCPSCLALFNNHKTCPRCKGQGPPKSLKGVLRRLGIEEGGDSSTMEAS